jgi:hypothetical protein
MKYCSLLKVKARCGKESALMDGTPIIIVEPYEEFNYDSVVFRGRITVRNQLTDKLETLWFDEIAEDFRPGRFSHLNPLDTIAAVDFHVKDAAKKWDMLAHSIGKIF